MMDIREVKGGGVKTTAIRDRQKSPINSSNTGGGSESG